jgi:hypothetical protein
MKMKEIIVEFKSIAGWGGDEARASMLIPGTEKTFEAEGQLHLFDDLEEGNLVKLLGYWHRGGEKESFLKNTFKVESLERIYSEKVRDILRLD